MTGLRFSLLSDGSSDEALVYVLRWLLEANGVNLPIESEWADLGRFRRPPKTLPDKIRAVLKWYPCNLLFIHRDAEGDPLTVRRREIHQAVQDACVDLDAHPPAVCVVPVRMMEAWFLFDEHSLRQAAGNPRGDQRLELPRLRDVEEMADPKGRLHWLLKEASGLHGRRLKNFGVGTALHRLAEITADFSPLRALSAFQCLEQDLRDIILQNNWAAE